MSFSEEAGNEYQEKSIVFNLIIGEMSGQNGDVNIDISGNGAGSSNSISLTISRSFSVIRRNVLNIVNTIASGGVTGGNSVSGNIGSSVIQTGNSSSESGIFNNFNFNSIRFW